MHITAQSERVRDEALKSKMAELHLNCQLLVTQITSIKSTVGTSQPDVNVRFTGHQLESIVVGIN